MKIKTTKKSATKTVVAKKTSAKPAANKAAKPAKKAATFTVHAEKGKSVYLAGSFNEWSTTAKKMAYKAKSGIYSATVQLAPGEYQYKFVIDGTWCADPENENSVKNDQGTFNSQHEPKSDSRGKCAAAFFFRVAPNRYMTPPFESESFLSFGSNDLRSASDRRSM